LRQGSMGCILVRPRRVDGEEADDDDDDIDDVERRRDALYDGIIAASTNTSLFRCGDSDVHAEINAIGQVASAAHRRATSTTNATTSSSSSSSSISTFGATAYITMPPCKNCFGALHASGIRRIVSRVGSSQKFLVDVASAVGIEMSCLTGEQSSDQRTRLDMLYSSSTATTAGEGGGAHEGGSRWMQHAREEKKYAASETRG
jgi:tRNA(Arg) A34 adenosine deaminase TadA